MDRPYDTPEGIRRFLGSLEGLHALREERRQAGVRKEFQRGFVARGRFFLTEDGRFGELTGRAAEIGEALPEIVALAEIEGIGRRAFGAAWRFSYRTPCVLAPPDRTCPECGSGWTVHDAHRCVDVHDIRRAWLDEHVGATYDELQGLFWAKRLHAQWDLLDPAPRIRGSTAIEVGAVATFHVTTWLHPECRARQAARDARWWAEDFLERAGLPGAEPELHDPGLPGLEGTYWFRVATAAGPVRFGRKPPGFVIDWKETGRALPDLYKDPFWLEPPKEHGPYHVRPSDETYLLRHFLTLRDALGF
jgi:hypothetical protein